jgi:hypothetical protein
MSEISETTLQEWKKKYGRVCKVSLAGTMWFYRPIDLSEYHTIQDKAAKVSDEKGGEVLGQEEIVRVAVLDPILPDKIPAGVSLKLSDEILKISGFVVEELQPEEV